MRRKAGTKSVAAASRWVVAACALAICWGAGGTMWPARPHGGVSGQVQPARGDTGPELRREHFARIDRERWRTEVYLEQIEPDLARLLDGLRHSPFPEKTLGLLLHQDFQGSPFTGQKEPVSEANGLTSIRWSPEPGPLLRRAAFLSGMARYAGTFSVVERTEAHTGLVEILDETPGTLRVRLQVDARFSGRAEGLAREDQARLSLEYVRAKDAGPWQLRGLILQEMRTLLGSRQFHHATGAIPAWAPGSILFFPRDPALGGARIAAQHVALTTPWSGNLFGVHLSSYVAGKFGSLSIAPSLKAMSLFRFGPGSATARYTTGFAYAAPAIKIN